MELFIAAAQFFAVKGGVILGLKAATWALIAFASSVVYGQYQKVRSERKAKAAFNASLKDQYAMSRTTNAPRQLVMGRRRVSGPMSFIGSTGTNSEHLWFTVCLASHEIDAVEAIYFDDVEVSLSGSLSTGADVTTAPYSGTKKIDRSQQFTGNGTQTAFTLTYTPISGSVSVAELASDYWAQNVYGVASVVGNVVTLASAPPNGANIQISYQQSQTLNKSRVWAKLGAAGQTALTDIVSAFPSLLDTNFKGVAVAYLVVRLTFDPDAFPSSIPNISARVRGAKCFDPRTGLTVWTENPALLISWYAQHQYGGRQPSRAISTSNISAVANACDTSTQYTIDGVLQSARALYTASMLATTDMVPRDVLDELCEAMAGKWVHIDGSLRLRAGVHVASSQTLDASWLHKGGSVIVQPYVRRESLFNVVRGVFADSTKAYRETEFPQVPQGSNPYLTQDGNIDLPLVVQFTAIDHIGQSQHVAGVRLRDTRNGLTVQLTCNMRAYTVEPFDTLAVTLERFGWSGKLFEVLQVNYTPLGGIRMLLKETASAIYTLSSDFLTADDTPNTSLPNPSTVEVPASLGITSGLASLEDGTVVPRVKVTWTQATAAAVRDGGRIEIQYWPSTQAIPAGDLISWPESGNATETVIPGLRVGTPYIFKARFINASGVRGGWTDFVQHKVAGQTDAAQLYRAFSRGYMASGAPHAPGLFNAITDATIANCARSYLVSVYNRTTGAWTSHTTYDVYISGAAAMAAALDSLTTDHIVVVVGYDDPHYNRLTRALELAMLRCGASREVYSSPQFKVRSAYILIGGGNCGEGNGREFYRGEFDDDPNAWLDVTFQIVNGQAIVDSSTTTMRVQQGTNQIKYSWVPGMSMPPQGFDTAGDTNSILMGVAPDGVVRPMWSAVSDGGNDAGGGWNYSGQQPIDITKLYQFSVWVQRTTATVAGTECFGVLANTVDDVPSGIQNGNPYFAVVTKANLVEDRWYLFVGYVFPTGYSGPQGNYSGIWDGITGTKVGVGTDYRWNSATRNSDMRAFQYYETVAGAESRFFDPRIHICDGSEPSVKDLLKLIGTAQLAYNAVNEPTIVHVATDTLTRAVSAGGGIVDRSFSAVTIANTSSEPWYVEVSIAGTRTLNTPAGMTGGDCDVFVWVSGSNETDSLLIGDINNPTTSGYHILNQPGNSVGSIVEFATGSFTVPPGKTFSFTPIVRLYVSAPVGSGDITLVTTDYTLTVRRKKL